MGVHIRVEVNDNAFDGALGLQAAHSSSSFVLCKCRTPGYCCAGLWVTKKRCKMEAL